jgi:hypothetical protein
VEFCLRLHIPNSTGSFELDRQETGVTEMHVSYLVQAGPFILSSGHIVLFLLILSSGHIVLVLLILSSGHIVICLLILNSGHIVL